MKSKKIIYSFLLLAPLWGIGQEAVVTAGNDATGAGGTLNYSIGQVIYTSIEDTKGHVSQGVQQAYDIEVISKEKEEISLGLSFNVYPNPTIDGVTLTVESIEDQSLSYRLLDVRGKVVNSQKLYHNKNKVDMENLPPAPYFLHVFTGKEEVRAFKIIKN